MSCDDGFHHHTSHTHTRTHVYVSCLPLDWPLRTGLQPTQPAAGPPDTLCVCDEVGNSSVPVLRRLGSSSSSSSRDLDVDGSSHEHLHIAFFIFFLCFFLVCCISLYLYVCMYCIFFATTSWWIEIYIFIGGLTAQVGWLGLRVGGHPALSLHSSDEPGELSQWPWSWG